MSDHAACHRSSRRARRLGPWLAGALLVLAASAQAQMSPVGTWRSVGENGQPKALVRIQAQGEGAAQVLNGRIEQVLKPGADPQAVCDKCTDARKGQPIVGLEIIRGAKRQADAEVWDGGRILDPEKGSDYGLRLTPIDGGARLQVRGSVGPFYRTQTWQRIQ